MAMLEIKDLEVYYGVIQAIKGISFDVNEGEVIALIGANGAGKTTTLQTITGMLSAKKGSILFEGTDITDKSVDINKMRQKIGMVFQQFNLFPNYTVKGNIMLIKQIPIRQCFPVDRNSVLQLQEHWQ